MKKLLAVLLVVCLAWGTSQHANSQVTVSVDPGAPWLGFMNVFERPANGGGYVFGSGWGTADLVATFSGPVLTLAPNSIGDPDPFWYTPSGGPGSQGNKTMDANMYQEVTGPYSGILLTFTGKVLSNTLTSEHSSVAFIKDFAPDYSSSVTTTVALTPGVFSVSMLTIPLPGRHVQFGFETIGPNVWITDVAPYGSVQVTAIPEPTTLAASIVGLIGLVGLGRRNLWEKRR